MANLKIRIFDLATDQPKTTVTVPGSVLKIASRLIPKRASSALHEKGVDVDEIVRLSENPDARGILVEVEDHEQHEKIVVSLE